MMYCKLLIISTLLGIGPNFSHRGGRESGISAFSHLFFREQSKTLFPGIYVSMHHINRGAGSSALHSKTHCGYSCCNKNF